MSYMLSDTHWYDALDRPYHELTDTVKILLGGGMVARSASSPDEPMASVIRPPGEETAVSVNLDSLQVDVLPPESPPEPAGRYTAPMNSQRPGCFIVLVDQSGSMNRRIAGTDIPKRQAVADAVNSLLYEAVLSATADDGVRHRFDIAVLGYGVGEQGVQSAFDQDLTPIGEIAQIARPPQKRVNITDGGFTEKDPTPLVYAIQELCTEAGNALIFNCHISDSEGLVTMYPGPQEAATFERRMRQLYEMSSVLPEPVRERAIERGYSVEPGARGYVLNADGHGNLHVLPWLVRSQTRAGWRPESGCLRHPPGPGRGRPRRRAARDLRRRDLDGVRRAVGASARRRA
jgi:hypothetical protein